MKTYATKIFTQAIAATLFFILAACQTITTQNEHPAIIVSPSNSTTQELSKTISQLLNNTPIDLAKNAFTETDSISIVRKEIKNINQDNLMGRNIEAPIIFNLIKTAKGCFIINKNTQERKKLSITSCKVLTQV